MQITDFAQLLPNFTCKLCMMRRGTLLILGHRVKGQGQLLHSVYKTLWAGCKLQFLPNRFQTSHVGWWDEKPYWFWVMWSKVKVNFWTLCIRPCGQYKEFMSNHQFHILVVGDEKRNSINFGSRGKRCIKPWRHNSVYVQSLSNFTCRLWMMRGEPLLILSRKTIGQGQLCPLRRDATLCVV